VAFALRAHLPPALFDAGAHAREDFLVTELGLIRLVAPPHGLLNLGLVDLVALPLRAQRRGILAAVIEVLPAADGDAKQADDDEGDDQLGPERLADERAGIVAEAVFEIGPPGLGQLPRAASGVATRARGRCSERRLCCLVTGSHLVDVETFRRAMQAVYERSRRQEPECRHYAQVYVAATRVEAAVRGKNAVYEYFYPAGQEILSAERF